MVQKGSGPARVDLTTGMISGYDPKKLGDQPLTITYGGQTDTSVTVNVKDYVTGIELSETGEVKANYNESLSDIIDRLDITYTVNYAKAGKKEAVKLATNMVSAYDATQMTTQILTVTYIDGDTNSFTVGDDFHKDLKITVENKIINVEIQKPIKDTYNYNEAIAMAGATVTLEYANGDKVSGDITKLKVYEPDETTPVTKVTATTFDSDHRATKTLKLVYTQDGKDYKADYPVTIINDVKGISVNSTTHKTSYNRNDTLDLDNLTILVERGNGETETVTVKGNSKANVSGFNSSVDNNNLPLTITYTENRSIKTSNILCNSYRQNNRNK